MEQTSAFVRTEREMADHLDNGVVGLHWASAEGILLWANRADYEPLGYTREDRSGITRPVPRRPRRPRRHRAASRRGRRLQTIRYAYGTRTAPCRTSCSLTSALFDDAGQFVHTRCFTVLAPASSGG